jgi:hypothetical protein
MEIIMDAVYYGDHDPNGEAAYCAACEGCGNAWDWRRTPEEALAAVPDAADWKRYDHTDYGAAADYWDGIQPPVAF